MSLLKSAVRVFILFSFCTCSLASDSNDVNDYSFEFNLLQVKLKRLQLESIPSLAAAVAEEESEILATHAQIVNEAKAINGRLNQYQLSIEKDNLNRLTNIFPVVNYKLSHPYENLKYYPWQATGSVLFNDQSLAVPVESGLSSSLVVSQEQEEPFSFILQNLSDSDIKINSIHVKLASDQGVPFPEAKIDIKIVKNWFVGSKEVLQVESYSLAHPILAPELLLKNDDLVSVDYLAKRNYLKIKNDNLESYIDISSPKILMPNNITTSDSDTLQAFSIKSYKSKQIWLTVSTNGLKLKGVFKGNIIVNYRLKNNLETLKIPFKIDILNIKLLKPELFYGVFYASQLKADFGLKALSKNKSQYLAELKDLKSHGIDYPTLYIGGDSESVISRYLRYRESLKFPCDRGYFIYGIADTTVPTSMIESNVKILQSLMQKNTHCEKSEIYLYGIDGASGNLLLKQQAAWAEVHKAGAKIFASSFEKDPLIVKNTLDNLLYSRISSKDVVAGFRKSNKDVFMYGNPQSGLPTPDRYRRNYGYFLILNNYTGAMPFAYQISFPDRYGYDKGVFNDGRCSNAESDYCSAWNNFDSLIFYDHMFTYPTSIGVIDTTQWEGYAAAITDIRYYTTLKELMLKCNQQNINCRFEINNLIDIDNPQETRKRIVEKIKLLL